MVVQIEPSAAALPRVVELPERSTAVVRIEGAPAELPALFREAFTLTSRAITETGGAAFAGEPFSRYESFGKHISAEAGFPFTGSMAPQDRVYLSCLPGGPAVTLRHVGPYKELDRAWALGQAWIAAHGLRITGAPWECYLTGPEDLGPPITQIYWPVR